MPHHQVAAGTRLLPAVQLDPEVKAQRTGQPAGLPLVHNPAAQCPQTLALNPVKTETLSYLTGNWRMFPAAGWARVLLLLSRRLQLPNN